MLCDHDTREGVREVNRIEEKPGVVG